MKHGVKRDRTIQHDADQRLRAAPGCSHLPGGKGFSIGQLHSSKCKDEGFS